MKKWWKTNENLWKTNEKLWKSMKKCEKVGKYIFWKTMKIYEKLVKNYEKVASFSVKKWKTWKTRLLHMGLFFFTVVILTFQHPNEIDIPYP